MDIGTAKPTAGRAGRGAAPPDRPRRTRRGLHRRPASSEACDDALAAIDGARPPAAAGRRHRPLPPGRRSTGSTLPGRVARGPRPSSRPSPTPTALHVRARPARPGRRRADGADQPPPGRAGARGHARQRPAVLVVRARPRRLPADRRRSGRAAAGRARRSAARIEPASTPQLAAGFARRGRRARRDRAAAVPDGRARPSATTSCSTTSRGDVALDEAVDRAIARTRRFAVRQERWFRRDPRIRWVDVDRRARCRRSAGRCSLPGDSSTMHADQAPRPRQRLPRLARTTAAVRCLADAAAARACATAARGIGADGLLIARSAGRRTARRRRWCCYNADGSRAEMSGNGIRCLAQAVVPRRGSTEATLATDRHRRRRATRVELRPGDEPPTHDRGPRRHGRGDARSTRRPAGTGSASTRCRPVAHLDLGNPHAVVAVDDVDDGRPRRARRPIVPERQPRGRRSRPRAATPITMRVHERGAGITEACGTGAVRGRVGRRVGGAWPPTRREITVHMAGGDAEVVDVGDDRVALTGRRARVHRRQSRCTERDACIERAIREQHRARRRHAAAGPTRTTPRPASTSWRCWSTPPAPTRSAASCSAATVPTRPTFVGKGKAEELRELCLAVDADTVVFDNELTPGPAVQPREAARPHRHRPHRGDPRHLRPERPHAWRARPRSSWPCCATACRGCAAGATAQALHASRRGGIGTRAARARPSSRSTAGGSCAASPSSKPSCSDLGTHRASAAQGAAPQRPAPRRDRRLHQRRQVDAAQPAHRRRRAGRGPAVRHPRPDAPAGWRCPAASRCC